MNSRVSKLASLGLIFRFEYIFATLPGLTITFFLCTEDFRELHLRPAVEGLLIVALMIFSCLGMNSIVDFDIDKKYATAKNRIPVAIEALGLTRIWAIIAIMNQAALVLAVDLCIWFQSWIPMGLVVAEAFFAYGYSLPGLQFKLRGVAAHAISLGLATGVIPFVLSAYTYLGTVPASMVLFITGFATVQYGFEFANQALDYLEDRAANLKTPAVRLGVTNSLRASLWVPVAGMVILFAALLVMYFERSSSLATPRSTPEVLICWGLNLVPLVVGYWLPINQTWKMLRLCRNQAAEDCVPQLPGLCHYAAWQASSVTGVAVGAAVYWFCTNWLW